jgi:hypothetical protein
MTTQEKVESMLFDLGMLERQAHEVMEKAKPQINANMEKINYRITWDRPASEYPEVMFTMIFNAVKPFAYAWYEENLPAAWNKDMFK